MVRRLFLLLPLFAGCVIQPDGAAQAAPQVLQYQVRMNVTQEMADAHREHRDTPELVRLNDVLRAQHASFVSQYEAFKGYVDQAEREGVQRFPLYQWTKDTIANPEKEAKYRRVFTVYVQDQEVYGEQAAKDLRAALTRLGEANGILSINTFDTNPAHNPQPPRAR